jgi:hypothetical protein
MHRTCRNMSVMRCARVRSHASVEKRAGGATHCRDGKLLLEVSNFRAKFQRLLGIGTARLVPPLTRADLMSSIHD